MTGLPVRYTSTTEASPLDAVVIGAGPAGVVSLRNLLIRGLNAISIERQSAVGGLWVDHIPAYSSLQVSRDDWAIHGVPCGTKQMDQRRLERDDVARYIATYVDKMALWERVFLNTEVVRVTPIRPMLFLVEITSVEKCGYLGGGRRIPQSTVRIYCRSVLFCAGLENYPSIPQFEGMKTATFPILHNLQIRDADDLPDEDILIVGGGPASMDICELAAVTKGADDVTLATRKTHLGLPDEWAPLLPWSLGARWLWDRGFTEIRVFYKLYKTFPVAFVDWMVDYWSSMWCRRYRVPEWLPVDVSFSRDVAYVFRKKLVKAIHDGKLTLQQAGIHSISGSEVKLTNNVIIRPKIMVCATGWRLNLDCLPPDRAGQSFETVQARLFCRFWDIDYPGLAFVSLSNGFMCATENANLISQAVAQALLGEWTEPSMEDMLRNIETEVKTGISVPGKAMLDLERAGFKGIKAGWEYY